MMWSPSRLRLYYECMAEEYGRHESWEKPLRPGRGLNQRFEEFLTAFAEIVGAKGPEAAEQQLKFATSTQKGFDRAHSRAVILNRAAAYESGFLRAKDLAALKISREEEDEE
jgi:hypothetical protein